MPAPALQMEGTWEEIRAHAAELAGHRVRVTVLPSEPEAVVEQPPSRSNRRMLELLTEWEQTPLTAEEKAVLDGLEQHLKEQPLSLNVPVSPSLPPRHR
jgi:hypothetical protein